MTDQQIAATIVIVLALLALIPVGVSVYRIKKIRSYPLVSPSEFSRYAGQRVILEGVAAGPNSLSPWTNQEGVYFEASQITYTRDREGSKRRQTYPLGQAGNLVIQDLHTPTENIQLESDTFSLLHLPNRNTSEQIVEQYILEGVPLWVTGVVSENKTIFDTNEWIQVSGRDAAGQMKFLKWVAIISGAVSLQFLLFFIIILSSGK